MTIVSLCEKTFFTFIKLIDQSNSFNSRDISPTSKSFFDKLKPKINQLEKFTYINNLKIAFLNKTFQIWTDNDFGQNYKNTSKSLRNIVVHRNLMGEDGYNIDNLKKEIGYTMKALSDYIALLIQISILYPFKDSGEILSDNNFISHIEFVDSPEKVLEKRKTQMRNKFKNRN